MNVNTERYGLFELREDVNCSLSALLCLDAHVEHLPPYTEISECEISSLPAFLRLNLE
jgi:hypothetical protein